MADEVEPRAATLHTVTSASANTALVTGPGSITPFTMNQPTSTEVDDLTPLTLLDQATLPVGPQPPARVIFSANMRSLAALYEPRPGVALTPGTTAPTWPKALLAATQSLPFTNGCWVASCPANLTFSITC